MPSAFGNILGQPGVRDFLRAAADSGRISHAYLFAGPAGSNKTLAAYALAQAVICEDGGCGECEACGRVMRRKHPDVRYCAPEGAQGYLVSQIREIVADASLAPIQASSKVYIVDRVDMLGTAAANAFLKTLEEPPPGVVIILLGRTRESVLPTIVSRCQVVPFRHIPAQEAAGIVSQNAGVPADRARVAIEACGGSITRAIDFCRSNERLAYRQEVLEVLAALDRADDWDVLGFSEALAVKSKAPLDVVRAAQEADLAESADFLAKSAVKQIEARNKRALAAAAVESLRQLTAIVGSWLRDVMVACAGAQDLVINADARAAIESAACKTDEARCAAALAAVGRCNEAIAYNVSPQTCIDTLLFDIREVLYGPDSPGKACI